jgi:hypothetical protein
VKARFGLCPESDKYLTGFFQAIEAFSHRIERDAIGDMFIFLPGGSEATNQPPLRHDIDRRGHFCQDGRMAVGVAE